MPSDTDPSAMLPLSVAMRELRLRYGVGPSYHLLWKRLTEGHFPAAGMISGKWVIPAHALPEVAEFFKLDKTK